MADALEYLAQWIWNENFWFPVGYSWKNIESDNPADYYYPKLRDISLQSLGLGVILLGVRYLLER